MVLSSPEEYKRFYSHWEMTSGHFRFFFFAYASFDCGHTLTRLSTELGVSHVFHVKVDLGFRDRCALRTRKSGPFLSTGKRQSLVLCLGVAS